MPLRRVSDLAPVAQVVVYAVMPSGEAMADSQNFPVRLCLNNKVQLQNPPGTGAVRRPGLTLACNLCRSP